MSTTYLGLNFEGEVPEGADCVAVDISTVTRDEPATLRYTVGGVVHDFEVAVPAAATSAVAWHLTGGVTALKSCCMEDYSADSGDISVAWV